MLMIWRMSDLKDAIWISRELGSYGLGLCTALVQLTNLAIHHLIMRSSQINKHSCTYMHNLFNNRLLPGYPYFLGRVALLL